MSQAPLPIFPLPLQPNGPPHGFDGDSDEDTGSIPSVTTAFDEVLAQRDQFNGRPTCVICGDSSVINLCLIIPEADIWNDLKTRNWIPQTAKKDPAHEPRNGLVMCPTHHDHFDEYNFYIRFRPGTNKYILVNFSRLPSLERYHGRAIALDRRDRLAPFPSLFIMHEWRVRTRYPFRPQETILPTEITYQDWIPSDESGSSLDRGQPPILPIHRSVPSTSTGVQQAQPRASPEAESASSDQPPIEVPHRSSTGAKRQQPSPEAGGPSKSAGKKRKKN